MGVLGNQGLFFMGAIMSTPSTRQRRRFLCLDCNEDTGKLMEFYFVHTDLWLSAAGSKEGMLCVGCLEERIGRRLTSDDFPDVTINSPRYGQKSQRLINRMSHA